MIRLKQSTAAQVVPLGVFVDAADGATPETALTINASAIKLWKNGGTSVTAKNDAAGATHRADGNYTTTLDATDTNTLGPLVITVADAAARPVRVECEVLPAIIFDSLGVNLGLASDMKAIGGDAGGIGRLTTFAYTIGTAVVHDVGHTPSTTTTIVINRFVSNPEICTVVDQLKGKRVRFTMNSSNQDGIVLQSARIVASTVWSGTFPNEIATLTVEPALQLAPNTGDILAIVDGPEPGITAANHVRASIEAVQESIQAAIAFRRMALTASYGTLAAGSTQTVLQISGAMTPALTGNDQVRGRVVMICDESGSQAGLKLQGGKVLSSTTTSITLETPLTSIPAAGNVIIVL